MCQSYLGVSVKSLAEVSKVTCGSFTRSFDDVDLTVLLMSLDALGQVMCLVLSYAFWVKFCVNSILLLAPFVA